jgi:polysaccharide export outer membrane protein
MEGFFMKFVIYALFVMLTAFSLPAAAMDYRLGSGDIVHVTVYDHPELLLATRVDEQGKIDFPLIGGVTVAGESASTAQRLIADALEKGGYIKKPQVNLIVKAYRSKQVSVLGQVNKPGKYPLETTSTISDLLAQAGGRDPGGRRRSHADPQPGWQVAADPDRYPVAVPGRAS